MIFQKQKASNTFLMLLTLSCVHFKLDLEALNKKLLAFYFGIKDLHAKISCKLVVFCVPFTMEKNAL